MENQIKRSVLLYSQPGSGKSLYQQYEMDQQRRMNLKFLFHKLVMILGIAAIAAFMLGCAGKDGAAGANGRDGVDGTPGIGTPGQGGQNGHSIVANSRVATALECVASAGTAVDFYLDLDGSLNFSAGDLLQAGVVACNGINGQDGQDGEDGEDGDDGIDGTNGQDGKSAYEIAVENGFVGTEAEWLASLQGEDGEDGQDGAPGTPGTSAVMTAYSLGTLNACVNVHTNIWAKRSHSTQVTLHTAASCNSNSRIDVGSGSVALSSHINEVYVTGNVMFVLEGYGSDTVLKKLVYQ